MFGFTSAPSTVQFPMYNQQSYFPTSASTQQIPMHNQHYSSASTQQIPMYSQQYSTYTQQIPMQQASYSQQIPIHAHHPQSQVVYAPSTVSAPHYAPFFLPRAVINAPYYDLAQPNPPPGWVITKCDMNITQGNSVLKYKIEIVYSAPDTFIADRQVEVPTIMVPGGWVKPALHSAGQRSSGEFPGIDSIKQTDDEYVYCCTLIYEPEPEPLPDKEKEKEKDETDDGHDTSSDSS